MMAASLSGCKAMSELAYVVGGALDPDQVRCIDHIGNCSLCGEPPGDSGDILPVDYECPECGQGGLAAASGTNVSGELEQFRMQSAEFRKELDAVNDELANRGQSLVQTRAELARVTTEIRSVRTDVSQWQTSMHQLHKKIRERDAARLAALGELSDNIEQIMQQR